ncbi:hypothetical protein [Streptomyces sp. NBC_00576]|uniref:hypothetical protein n=1 Tax=Streptomyces sp. NBC_00576 TaxID=2903665 RepID=UPI002E802AA2|nr:hypothetical protein [Streptomyces sp. NBC_00576]WUB71813.1 hypothetical protein OG734_17860 [Streptomyces sp. NBC_00576]
MTSARGTRVQAAVPQAELPMLRAYRHWFEHARKCADCKRVSRVQDGCENGQGLWDDYRRAYDGGAG